jgi:hypothetical protein
MGWLNCTHPPRTTVTSGVEHGLHERPAASIAVA